MQDGLRVVVLLNRSSKCNELFLRGGSVKWQLKQHYVKAMEEAERRLINLMKREVMKTVDGDGPGKPEWRKEMTGILQEVYQIIADEYIEAGVGIPSDETLSTIVKAMVILEGAGSAAGNSPIRSRPGEEVWNDDLSGKWRSSAKTEYLLPDGFNQKGNHFVENAMKLMRKHFNDVLREASANLPDSVFYMNVLSKPR